jgi:hypothetical protein
MWEKPSEIAKYTLIIGAMAVIVASIIITYTYVKGISRIASAESNVEVLATLASIFVSITALVFVDIIRSESWKRFKYGKVTSVIMVLLLISAVYFLFGASSTGIISSTSAIQNTILFMYGSIEMCVIILIILLPIYTYFS